MEISSLPDKFNYGVALLKMFMCFEVILVHFWQGTVSLCLIPFDALKGFSVPVFMFVSFYFTEKTLNGGGLCLRKVNAKISLISGRVKGRILRIIYPQLGWAIIYWIVYIVLQFKLGMNIGFDDLLWQIFTGHRLNPPMWFLTVLIALTLVFFIAFSFIDGRKRLIFVFAVSLFSFWVQYSGYNVIWFGNLRFELKYPLGRFFEMIPYASLGYIVAYFDIFNSLKKKRVVFVCLFGILSLILLKYKNLIPPAPGFSYSNNIYLIRVFFLVGFAYLLPFEGISEKSKQIVRHIVKFTLGVYCMHWLVGLMLNVLFAGIGMKIDSFILCVLIYICSYSISFIMCMFSSKYFKLLVE